VAIPWRLVIRILCVSSNTDTASGSLNTVAPGTCRPVRGSVNGLSGVSVAANSSGNAARRYKTAGSRPKKNRSASVFFGEQDSPGVAPDLGIGQKVRRFRFAHRFLLGPTSQISGGEAVPSIWGFALLRHGTKGIHTICFIKAGQTVGRDSTLRSNDEDLAREPRASDYRRHIAPLSMLDGVFCKDNTVK
jgi:hypothetical protein